MLIRNFVTISTYLTTVDSTCLCLTPSDSKRTAGQTRRQVDDIGNYISNDIWSLIEMSTPHAEHRNLSRAATAGAQRVQDEDETRNHGTYTTKHQTE